MPKRAHSTISANVLFHFTTKENLLGILRNEFYARYALENHNIFGEEVPERHIAIPMVSFCDIPLSQIKDHVEKYGDYALGLTKDWAKSHGIAPVLYAYPGSLTSEAIANIFENLPPYDRAQKFEGLQQAQRNLTYFSFYVKMYEGRMYRDDAYLEELVRFYDEREWRYIPSISVLSQSGMSSFLRKPIYDDPLMRSAENSILSKADRLSFEPKYIKYIITKSESEILETVDTVLQIKGPNFPYDEVRKLTSRIISLEQVLEDF